MKTLFIGGTLVTPYQVLPGYTLIVEDDKIGGIRSRDTFVEADAEVVDASGKWIAPGYVDIHIHGAMNASVMDATPDVIQKIGRYICQFGVTSYLPTTWSATPELTLAAIQNIAAAPQPEDGARHLGAHVEGPYLSLDYRGAQLPEVIRPPAAEEYRQWFKTGVVKLITIAPEREGSAELIAEGRANGVAFSIGHSEADYDQVIRAADQGVRQATHIFNGMVGLHHRNPGTAGGILADDRIYAQLICDGVHVHPAVVKTLVRAKGASRVILITDAVRGTGLDDGVYEYEGQQKIIIKDGVARTPQGGLSGSTLTMDRAVRNVMNFTGLPFHEVLPMATSVPAEAMGWKGKKGTLEPGADADVILLDAGFNVEKTMVAGRFVKR